MEERPYLDAKSASKCQQLLSASRSGLVNAQSKKHKTDARGRRPSGKPFFLSRRDGELAGSTLLSNAEQHLQLIAANLLV
ncbi:hypothetical protein RvY_15717 [Ramazzottius varieornatus]|uniref:Uncharacterized protein n=1 Tax=Ramazzottius varieornatus TaxID=947166 RepID=A0A1D1VVX4_RAMVA|nr:hypothetical protein RvY_15717 [Ramazzottius varieornatus]